MRLTDRWDSKSASVWGGGGSAEDGVEEKPMWESEVSVMVRTTQSVPKAPGLAPTHPQILYLSLVDSS